VPFAAVWPSVLEELEEARRRAVSDGASEADAVMQSDELPCPRAA
jgi:hypothetical protein